MIHAIGWGMAGAIVGYFAGFVTGIMLTLVLQHQVRKNRRVPVVAEPFLFVAPEVEQEQPDLVTP